ERVAQHRIGDLRGELPRRGGREASFHLARRRLLGKDAEDVAHDSKLMRLPLGNIARWAYNPHESLGVLDPSPFLGRAKAVGQAESKPLGPDPDHAGVGKRSRTWNCTISCAALSPGPPPSLVFGPSTRRCSLSHSRSSKAPSPSTWRTTSTG